MSSFSTETNNFFKSLLSRPTQWLSAFAFYSGIAGRKVYYRIRSNPKYKYPVRARKLSAIPDELVTNSVQPANLPELPFGFEFKTALVSRIARKGTIWKDITKSAHHDEEYFYSLNRWYWLIYDQEQLLMLTPGQIIQLAEFWILSNLYNHASPVWEPYSVSERISSLCACLMIKADHETIRQWVDTNETVRNFLLTSMSHLKSNLEYYPNGVTFNHVVNDLKGVITAAILLGKVEDTEAAFELLVEELDIVIDEDGFLREGSSHYQLIITRWICELNFLIEKAGQHKKAKKLVPYCKKLISKTFFFLDTSIDYTQSKMPLFGDISPDFDPEWLIRFFGFNETESWNYGQIIRAKIATRVFSTGCYSFSEFTKIHHDDWIIYIRHGKSHKRYFPNHSHDDFGSFVLYYKGISVVADPGRKDYALAFSQNEYCGSNVHGTLTVNQLLPVLSNNYYYLPSAYKAVIVKRETDGLALTLKVSNSKEFGAYRLNSYQRRFNLDAQGIFVTDHIEGTGVYEMSASIALDKNIEITGNKKDTTQLILQHTEFLLRMCTSEKAEMSDLNCSNRYGNEEKTTMLVVKKNGRENGTLSVHFQAN